jgi:vancomycin resistance protein YoaR
MNSASFTIPQQASIITRIMIAVLLGISLFLMGAFVWSIGYQLIHVGKILPGVSVAGVDLSGLNRGDAAEKLSQTLSYPVKGRVLFRDGERIWLATPAELGMTFDPSTSARMAYSLGRAGGLFGSLSGQWKAWRNGVDVNPVITFDERLAYVYLQKLASEVDQPIVEASLSVQGTEVITQPGKIGRELNVDTTLVYLRAQLQTFRDGEVALAIEEKTPQLMDLTAQAEIARNILRAPLHIILDKAQAGDPGPWIFDIPTVAYMLRVEHTQSEAGTQVWIGLDPQALRDILAGIAAQVDRQPRNARFIFNDETHQLELIQPALIGRSVDKEATLIAINNGVIQGQHDFSLAISNSAPVIGDTATGEELGITALVSSETTYFYGSSTQRIQNIQTAAGRFHGLLVAPGEIFSMGQALGDVSLDNGYAEALIIYGGRTIKGVGGGVCQVSTTLFRTVFFGGYPVNERYSHAYRVSYYEMTASESTDSNLAGLDATVYFPLVDFKFTNDTPFWLLMETYVNIDYRTLTWKFYSTSDGRSVDWVTSGPEGAVPAPKPLFQKNPDLEENQIKQVDWSAEGADVVIVRTVYRGGQIYFQDEFKTHYEPWQAVCEFGPGTKDPEKLAKKMGLCQR